MEPVTPSKRKGGAPVDGADEPTAVVRPVGDDTGMVRGEYELSWMPYFMYRLDQVQDDFSDYIKMPPLKQKASDYLRTRIFHGMIDDPDAEVAFHKIGYSQVLWGSDFPHVRSIGIETQSRLGEMVRNLPSAAQQQIVGGNAARLFNL